ncbi:APG6 domain containing protein [Pyrenophora tritici-repentis]|nr:APG6 domain containing protein [Pyrenophora tritici-repentis]
MDSTQKAPPVLPESQQPFQDVMDDVVFVRTVEKPKPKRDKVLGPKTATPTKQATPTDLPPYEKYLGQIIDLGNDNEDMSDTTPTPAPTEDSTNTLPPRKDDEESYSTHRPVLPKVPLPEDGPGYLPAMRRVLEQALGKETLDRLEQYSIQDVEAKDKYIRKLETEIDMRYKNFFTTEQLQKEKMDMLKARAKGGDEVTRTERELLRLEIEGLKGELENKESSTRVLRDEIDTLKAGYLEREKELKAMELELYMELEKTKTMKLELEKVLEEKNRYEKLQKKLGKRKLVNIVLREEIAAQKNKVGELEKALEDVSVKDKRIQSLRSTVNRLEKVLYERNRTTKPRKGETKTQASK